MVLVQTPNCFIKSQLSISGTFPVLFTDVLSYYTNVIITANIILNFHDLWQSFIYTTQIFFMHDVLPTLQISKLPSFNIFLILQDLVSSPSTDGKRSDVADIESLPSSVSQPNPKHQLFKKLCYFSVILKIQLSRAYTIHFPSLRGYSINYHLLQLAIRINHRLCFTL